MKREIKFCGLGDSGLSKDKWVFGHYYQDAHGKILLHIIKDSLGQIHSINPNTLSQYTGICDKDGLEIYENHIVKDEFGRMLKVGYWNYRLCWIALTETNFNHADLFEWVDRDTNGNLTNKARVKHMGNVF